MTKIQAIREAVARRRHNEHAAKAARIEREAPALDEDDDEDDVDVSGSDDETDFDSLDYEAED
jgi:hypothetical protein